MTKSRRTLGESKNSSAPSLAQLLGTDDPAKQVTTVQNMRALIEARPVTLVLQYHAASDSVILSTAGANLPIESVFHILDLGRTALVRAQVEAEARKAETTPVPTQ